jgi:hypothetical protein
MCVFAAMQIASWAFVMLGIFFALGEEVEPPATGGGTPTWLAPTTIGIALVVSLAGIPTAIWATVVARGTSAVR